MKWFLTINELVFADFNFGIDAKLCKSRTKWSNKEEKEEDLASYQVVFVLVDR